MQNPNEVPTKEASITHAVEAISKHIAQFDDDKERKSQAQQAAEFFVSKAVAFKGIDIDTTLEVVGEILTQIFSEELPELTGSEKQVAWANDIRAKMIANPINPLSKESWTKTDAEWFINNRHSA